MKWWDLLRGRTGAGNGRDANPAPEGRKDDVVAVQWRHDRPAETAPPIFTWEATLAELGWRGLLQSHRAFRATDVAEYRSLIAGLRRIEELVLTHEELREYYAECMRPDSEPAPSATAVAAQAPTINLLAPTRRLAMLQLLFMEDAYFTLRLQRYANAPDNRGWMNLFRRWGRSAVFNTLYEESKALVTAEFTSFYDEYLRDYRGTIDEYPVPHPWDEFEMNRHRVARDSNRVRGVFLDGGVHDDADGTD